MVFYFRYRNIEFYDIKVMFYLYIYFLFEMIVILINILFIVVFVRSNFCLLSYVCISKYYINVVNNGIFYLFLWFWFC